VHRPDQRGDRATVERRQEGSANGTKDAADEVVRLMLALLDLGDLLGSRAAVDQLLERLRGGDQRRCMRLEHAEEIARPRQQALEPGEHMKAPVSCIPSAGCDSSMTGFSPSA